MVRCRIVASLDSAYFYGIFVHPLRRSVDQLGCLHGYNQKVGNAVRFSDVRPSLLCDALALRVIAKRETRNELIGIYA